MNRRLWLLLIAHLIAGVSFCVWRSTHRVPSAWHEPIYFYSQYILPTALVSCESFLLAFWAAMSGATLWKRLTGLVVGMIYLESLIAFSPPDSPFELWLTPATGMVAVALLFVRRCSIDLRRIADGSRHDDQRRLRSLISGLMCLTPAVAVLIVFSIGFGQNGIFLNPDGYFFPSLRFVVFGLAWYCFAVIDMASLWATLGHVSSIARSMSVIVVSIVVGWCYSYAFRFVEGGSSRGLNCGSPLAQFFACFSVYWYWHAYIISIVFLRTLALLGSLHMVRSCGYRLSWLPPNHARTQCRFQFSLRKLMLWTVIWGAYLSLWRLIDVGALTAVIATLWFVVAVVIRLKWGSRQGWKIATGMGLGFTVILATWIGLGFCRSVSAWRTMYNANFVLGLFVVGGILLGPFVALYTFIAADFVVRAVDWLDHVLQSKTPQAPGNQTQRPDAPATEE